MKKIVTTAILMGIVVIGGEKTMAAGSAYTGYMVAQRGTEKTKKVPEKNIVQKTIENTALINHR